MNRRFTLSLIGMLGLSKLADAQSPMQATGTAPLKLSDDEWRKRPTPAQYRVLQQWRCIEVCGGSMKTIRELLRIMALGLTLMAPFVAYAQSSNPAASNPPATTAKALFAGGCFWCVESDFDKVPGVISTTSGYSGGRTANPTYQQVSSHNTGHAEVVEIVFDPTKVSYSQLVEYFWRTIDPTTKDQQFCDRGNPYRSAIFALDADQLKIAQASKLALDKIKPFKETIVTEVMMATTFYPAEDYHQDYYKKNPVRYKYYRTSCGRDARLQQLWGDKAAR